MKKRYFNFLNIFIHFFFVNFSFSFVFFFCYKVEIDFTHTHTKIWVKMSCYSKEFLIVLMS